MDERANKRIGTRKVDLKGAKKDDEGEGEVIVLEESDSPSIKLPKRKVQEALNEQPQAPSPSSDEQAHRSEPQKKRPKVRVYLALKDVMFLSSDLRADAYNV